MDVLQKLGYSVCLREKDWPVGVLITENPYILFMIPLVSQLFTLSPVKTIGPRSFIGLQTYNVTACSEGGNMFAVKCKRTFF